MAWNFFGGNNTNAQQQPAADQQIPAGQQQHPAGDPQQQQQAPNGQQPASKEEPNVVDIYADLFNNNGDDKADLPPSFNLGDDAITKAAQSINFANNISTEDLAAMQQGDQEAMMRVLQSVGQNAYSAALNHSSKLTNEFVSQRSEYERKNIPGAIKRELTQSAFNNETTPPHVKSELMRVADQLQRKHPDASPEWIARNAEEYMYHNIAAMLGMEKDAFKATVQQRNMQESAQSKDPENIDWSKEFQTNG